MFKLRWFAWLIWNWFLRTNFFIAAHKGAEIVECVRKYIWTKAHKIYKAWVFINQILPRCFCFYGLWLNKSNHWVRQLDISKPTDINQSMSTNRFYPIETLIFIQDFFCFPIIHHDSIFLTYVKRVCYSNKWKAWHLCRSILKLLMVI